MPPGKKVIVKQDDAKDEITRLRQAALGANPKDGDSVLSVEVGGKTHYLATLSKGDDTEVGRRLGDTI